MELTEKQSARIARNKAIIERFHSFEGAKTVIIEKVAKEFALSIPSIRKILTKSGCIGTNTSQ